MRRRIKQKAYGLFTSRTFVPESVEPEWTAHGFFMNVLEAMTEPAIGVPRSITLLNRILQILHQAVLENSKERSLALSAFNRLKALITSLRDTLSSIVASDYSSELDEDLQRSLQEFHSSLQRLSNRLANGLGQSDAASNGKNRLSDVDEAYLLEILDGFIFAAQQCQLCGYIQREEQDRLREASTALQGLPVVESAFFNAGTQAGLPMSCVEGTLVLDRIQRWIESSENGETPSLFWLYGMPKIGKSTIARMVIERSNELGLLSSSFFFSRTDTSRSDPSRVLPNIAYQLAQLNDAIKLQIGRAVHNDSHITTKPISEHMDQLFIKPLSHIQIRQKVIVVLDALDECDAPGSTELLQVLLTAAKAIPLPVCILVTSRPDPHIRAVFDRPANRTRAIVHDIESSIIESDLGFYMRSKIAEVAAEMHLQIPAGWPNEDDASLLITRTGKLLISLVTAIRFICDKEMSDPPAQLQTLLRLGGTLNPDQGNSDWMFELVLSRATLRSTNVIRKHILGQYQLIVGTIVLLREPLAMNTLARLLLVEERFVYHALRGLHPIITHALDSHGALLACHSSFLDFITDPARCHHHELQIDRASHERRLTVHCLRVLSSMLKHDMADIRDPSLLNVEVEGLRDRVRLIIPVELRYSCLHWSSHLCSLPSKDAEVETLLHEFSSKYVLFWFEAMSLLGRTYQAVTCMKNAHAWMVNAECTHSLIASMWDGYRFILTFFEPIKASALHVYHSALPFIPHQTSLPNNYQYERNNSVKVLVGLSSTWHANMRTLLGHTGSINAVAFYPDGSRFASGSHDHTVRLWDAMTGEQISVLNSHTSSINTVAFSPDGSCLASGSHDHTICLWDAMTGEQISVLSSHADSINAVAFSPDGSRLASASDDRTIRLWDPVTGEQIAVLSGHTDSIHSVAFSPDGSRLASGSHDHTICLWDPVAGEQIAILSGHTHWVTAVVFSLDGSRLASASGDHTVRLWDAMAGGQIAVLNGHTDWIRAVAFSPDGSRLASGSHDETVHLWDAMTGEQIAVLIGHTNSIRAVAFSPDGSRLASGSDDRTVRLWDAKTGEQIAALNGHTDRIRAVTFSPDASRLVSGSHDGTVYLWDAAAGEQIAVPSGHTNLIRAVAFSPDGSHLASSSFNGTVRIWDIMTGERIAVLSGHTLSVTAVVFSPDGSRLASASNDSTVRLWDAMTGARIAVLSGHADWVTTVTFSPNGSRLASGSDDRTVRLWDAKTGEQLAVLIGHTNLINTVAFSPDGSRLASGSDDYTIRLWDAMTGEQIAVLSGHSLSVTAVTFSPDGSRLASGSDDHTVCLWSAMMGEQIAALGGHTRSINAVAFSPDGLYLTSRSDSESLGWKLYPDMTPTSPDSPDISSHALTFPSSPLQPYSLTFESAWLWYSPASDARRRLCYLPPEYEIYTDIITLGNFVAFGCKGGQVVVLDISQHPLLRS